MEHITNLQCTDKLNLKLCRFCIAVSLFWCLLLKHDRLQVSHNVLNRGYLSTHMASLPFLISLVLFSLYVEPLHECQAYSYPDSSWRCCKVANEFSGEFLVGTRHLPFVFFKNCKPYMDIKRIFCMSAMAMLDNIYWEAKPTRHIQVGQRSRRGSRSPSPWTLTQDQRSFLALPVWHCRQ